MNQVVPIRDISRRLPQAGRIRLGKPPAKGQKHPTSLSKFRFTSASSELLDKVAELYGGVVAPWNEPKTNDRFELYSEASEIRVVLAPDPFHAAYEYWKGAVNVRRCDGETCVVQVPGNDGPEQVERDCLCVERGVRECEPKLRLNVILPEVRGLGVWRLDTSSWAALHEMPAIVESLQNLDGGRSMVEARLRIETRHDVIETRSGKQRRNFNVPVLDIASSLDQVAAGEHRVSLGAATTPAAGVGPPTEAIGALGRGGYADPDDGYFDPQGAANIFEDIADAEVVPDEEELDAWAKSLSGRERNAALSVVRRLAGEDGRPLPATFDVIERSDLERVWLAWKES